MNNVQKLYSCITGYGHDLRSAGARWQSYYDAKTEQEKINEIEAYSDAFAGVDGLEAVSQQDAQKVHNAIKAAEQCNSSNDLYYLYESLN